jgi:predicted alpha-1,6-mannanase (GH76 family)
MAQWTAANAQTAFNSYNNAFYFNPEGANYDYRVDQGSTTATAFWVAAEEIELAVDAYHENPSSANETMVTQLTNGFIALHGTNWSSDIYDDDLMWATIAFARAYGVTSNSSLLSDAETNFNTVWSRGYDTTFGGGIWWQSSCESGCFGAYKNSASNWTFVIAGVLLYDKTSDTTYLNEANTVYSWAYSNLYSSSTGEVYDGINSSGTSTGQYSYNYGVAIGAHYWENKFGDANNAATYLMNDLPNYAGTANGYNILPNYGQRGSDGSGFNGIALRWTAYAYVNGAISNSSVLPWMQQNVSSARAEQNSSGLSWNDWVSVTPNGGQYSFDCSDAVVGMQDVPVP